MQAKIIQVIEVSEFVPNQVNDKKTYFLPDGTKLVTFDPFASRASGSITMGGASIGSSSSISPLTS